MRRNISLGVLLALPFAVSGAESVHHGIMPLKDALFTQDDDVKCLQDAVENGDPATGASTFLLKAAAGCRVRAHYHTAEEQLIVIRGSVSTGMKGMPSVALTAGGFAAMPSKAVHWFSCTGPASCLIVVTFDRKYDITWIDSE
jgi:quercetin dioxygenase-like cupin family protein